MAMSPRRSEAAAAPDDWNRTVADDRRVVRSADPGEEEIAAIAASETEPGFEHSAASCGRTAIRPRESLPTRRFATACSTTADILPTTRAARRRRKRPEGNARLSSGREEGADKRCVLWSIGGPAVTISGFRGLRIADLRIGIQRYR
jgi:hypothetical protein